MLDFLNKFSEVYRVTERDSKDPNKVATSVQSEMGKLYVVATPIGNLDDISPRAVQTLKDVSCILAEDTRHSKRLTAHFCINTRLRSCHEHNEESLIDWVAEQLSSGQDLALISDAGTPLISDPGFVLVRALREKQFDIRAVPGPSSIIAALSIAGLPTDRFVFEGFLPAKKTARESYLANVKSESRTLVFLESSHRILSSVTSLRDVFGDQRRVVIARELTKRFETVLDGAAYQLVSILEADDNQTKGEFVVMVEGVPKSSDANALEFELKSLLEELMKELPLKKAVALASRISGARKNEVYSMALELKDREGA